MTSFPDKRLAHRVIGAIIRAFVPLGRRHDFSDIWYQTLPVDEQGPVDTLLKAHFTELWIPIEEADRALAVLERMFIDQVVAGNLITEIYGAKRSPFWLSPSYERDVVRVDAYWWAYNVGEPEEYFAHYWNHLLDIPGVRLHWGKYLPKPGQICGNTVFDVRHLKSVYPRLERWLQTREAMDPDQIFVNDYWRSIFEIP